MLFLDVFMTLSRKDLGKLYSLEASVVPAVVPGPCVVLAPDLAVVVLLNLVLWFLHLLWWFQAL